jgi:hypothetical protein
LVLAHSVLPVRLGVVPDRSRRPRDPNQLGKLIVDIATGQVEDTPEDMGKNSAAVALGRKGGLKGGKARAAKLTAEQRRESAQRAARARWDRKDA